MNSAPGAGQDWSSAILYSVLIDRFAIPATGGQATGPLGRHGGTLQALTGRLDYVAALGVTGLLLSPVYRNEPGGYHGYWPVDFEAVDPSLGTIDDLRHLVDRAHALGLDVILDMVANHTGYHHPWVADATRSDWFHREGPIHDWDDPWQVERGDLCGLPDLAQENPEVARYLLENVEKWLTGTGADGIRIDAAKHMPKSFLRRLAGRARRVRPGALVLGEVALNDRAGLESYAMGGDMEGGGGLNAVFDFPLAGAIREAFAAGGDMVALAREIDGRGGRLGAGGGSATWATFIDNHDLPRMRHLAGPDGPGLRLVQLALFALMTLPGLPVIYYGTERAMDGGPDPDCRRDMDWDSTRPDFGGLLRALADVRRAGSGLETGPVIVEDVDRAFLAYRTGRFVVALNAGPGRVSRAGLDLGPWQAALYEGGRLILATEAQESAAAS